MVKPCGFAGEGADGAPCPNPAVARVAMNLGCVCFPGDREQDLCSQHLCQVEPIGNFMVMEYFERPMDWLRAAAQTLHEFRELRDGWDSYGGRPIDPANIREALCLLWVLAESGLRIPPPSISPMSTGGVTLTWSSPAVEVEIAIEGDAPEVTVEESGKPACEWPGGRAVAALVAYADRLQPDARDMR